MSAWGIRVGSTIKDLLTDFGVRVENVTGMGMPAMDIIYAPYALMDGGQYQRARVAQRIVTLACNTSASTVAGVHANLATLIDYINRDVAQPFYLRYTVGSTTYELPCYYMNGIDAPNHGRKHLKFAIQCVSLDPLWRATSDSTASPAVTTTVTGVCCLISRLSTGDWYNSRGQVTSSGGTEGIYCILEMPNGDIYVGGIFTEIGGVAVGNVAKWNGTTWSKPSIGGGNYLALDYAVRCMITDGTRIYVGGDFEENTESDIYYYGLLSFVPGTSIGAAYGTGVATDHSNNEGIYALALDGSGSIYAAGKFDNAKDGVGAAVANTQHIAKWTGSAWASVTPSGAANGQVRSLLYHVASGQVIAGGDYTSIDGVAASYIAAYTGSAWVAMSSGFGGIVRAVRQGPDTVYAAGDFDGCVAKLQGGAWVIVGAGLSGPGAQVLDMRLDSTGRIYCATNAVTYSGATAIRVGTAVWDGSAWASLDVDLPGSLVAALTIQPLSVVGGLMVGYSYDTGAATVPAVTTVANAGSANAYPIITISRAGDSSAAIYAIGNLTAGDYIYLQYTILSGETITIDLTPGAKTVWSNMRGNIASRVRASSNLGTFRLLPGNNAIYVFVPPNGSGTSTVTITWRNRYWSTDG